MHFSRFPHNIWSSYAYPFPLSKGRIFGLLSDRVSPPQLCWLLELFLKLLENLGFGGEFRPNFDILECWEVFKWCQNPPIWWKVGESLTLAERRLYRNELYDKFLKAPKMMLIKVWQGVHVRINASCPKSNASPSFNQNWWFPYYLNTL